MLIWENVKLAFQALLANKMRALLTMLGIIIGIGAVIAIMTVSSSLTNSISDSFQEMGANNITVGLKQTSSTTETRSNGLKFGAANRNSMVEKEDLITDDMLSELKTEFSDKIDAIAISETVASGTVHDGSNTANISISGINSEYFSSDDVTLLAGRRLTSNDNTGKKKVIMISDKVVDQIFDGDSQKALSQKIQVEIDGVYYQYYVVGVYKYESNNSFSSSSDEDITTTAYIPILTGKAQTHSDEGYQQFTVVTKSGIDSVSTFATQIENFFAPYYSSNEDYKVSTTTMESMTESMSDMIGTVSIAISFIAGISLLVGGIGVMNIMLVSITERTREIGTRKALGAKNSSIRFQFIIESMILCLIGGILGILVGFLLGAIAASILGYSAAVPVAAIIVAVGFSMVIGIFFGYYPANKAARMDPIEALRYECGGWLADEVSNSNASRRPAAERSEGALPCWLADEVEESRHTLEKKKQDLACAEQPQQGTSTRQKRKSKTWRVRSHSQQGTGTRQKRKSKTWRVRSHPQQGTSTRQKRKSKT